MTIAYLVSEYPARSHTFIRREIQCLRESGIEVKPFSLHRCPSNQILNEEEQAIYDETWSIFPIGKTRFLQSHIKFIFSLPKKYTKVLFRSFSFSDGTLVNRLFSIVYFFEAIYLADKLKSSNVKALHVHFANSGGKVGALAAELLDLPLMLSLHGSIDFEYPAILWLNKLAKQAQFVRCVTYYGASQVKRVLENCDFNKVFVSYCGIPKEYKEFQRKEEIKIGSKLKLLSVGRLSPEKGQIVLLETAYLLRQRNINFELTILGDGPDLAMLQNECHAKKLDEQIRFVNSVDEKTAIKIMANADILVCSSFMEGLPQVLLESMMVGVPVVAPFIAGIPELVVDSKTGMLYPAGHTTELADKICQLATTPELYKEISSEGYQRISQFFVINKTMLPLLEKTKTLIG